MKYDTYTLEEIKKRLPNTQVLKERKKWYKEQDHTRWVFLDKSNNQCIKLWNETYVRRDTVPRALENNFYDEKLIPAFCGLIYDKNKICRGYVMHQCKEINIDRVTWGQVFEYVKLKTKQTGFFAYDFLPEHVMLYEKPGHKPQLSLIDLEGVYHILEYEEKLDDHINYLQEKNIFMKNKAYEEYVLELLRTN